MVEDNYQKVGQRFNARGWQIAFKYGSINYEQPDKEVCRQHVRNLWYEVCIGLSNCRKDAPAGKH